MSRITTNFLQDLFHEWHAAATMLEDEGDTETQRKDRVEAAYKYGEAAGLQRARRDLRAVVLRWSMEDSEGEDSP